MPLPPGVLFPLRIDVSSGDRRVREFFCWDPSSSVDSFYHFARLMCLDEGITSTSVETSIMQQMREQVSAS